MSEAATLSTGDARRVGGIRIGIGLVQGLAIWALSEAERRDAWPSSDPGLFGALFFAATLTPFVVLAGITTLRGRTLAIWGIFAAAVLAGIGLHATVRQVDPRFWYSGVAAVLAAAGLFIGHHLVEGGDGERRLIARYPRYFEIAWKHGVQLVLSAGFVGVFWIVLVLGAMLFDLIGIDFVTDLIMQSWFAVPVTTTMFAAAVHLTDVRAGIIKGIRTVALTLLSWLLPVLAFLAAAFLLALPFTGLDPLWKTRSAAGILLGSAAVLIVLINAAYQDGEPDGIVPLVLRAAGRLGGVLIAPLVGLAGYALWLRISQHGLTPDRVVGAAFVLVGAVYAIGYAWSALRLGRWMRRVEVTNVVAAFVGLAVLLAILSPPADPAKLSVNDQMARLKAGKVSAEKFDYAFLRDEGAVYGKRALEALKAGGGEAGRRTAELSRPQMEPIGPETEPRDPSVWIDVWPRGAKLPEDFLTNRARRSYDDGPGCFDRPSRCNARMLDLDGDGREEVLLGEGDSVFAYARGADHVWRLVGNYSGHCAVATDVGAAFRDGALSTVAPRWRDLRVGARTSRMIPATPECEVPTLPQP